MTTAADLLALAERVERGESSDALAIDVMLACGAEDVYGDRRNFDWRGRRYVAEQMWSDMHENELPDPLRSLDAAVGLVPARASWYAGKIGEAGAGRVYVDQGPGSDVWTHNGDARTPAAALTAAALRARAQEMKDE